MRILPLTTGLLTLALAASSPAQITNTATAETSTPGLENRAGIFSSTLGFPEPTHNNFVTVFTDVIDSATVMSTVVTEADLAVTKTATPDTVPSGGTVVYRIEVENLGPSSAQDVTVEDPLPAQLAFVSVDDGGGSCTTPAVGSSGTVSCVFAGATLPDVVRVVEITADVPVATSELSLDNVATASSATADPVSSNDEDVAVLAVGAVSILEIPVLSGAGLLALFLVLASLGVLAIRRSAVL